MSQRLRVVHVYKDAYPPVEGGIERIIYHLARLTAGEFEPHILVTSRSWRGVRREAAGIPITEVPSAGRLLSTPLAPGLITALRRSRADLFHFHIPHPTGEMAFLLSGLRTPAVATYHSDVVRQRLAMKLYHPFFQRFLARMSLIMPTSRRYLASSIPLAGHQARCRVVPLGYPLEDYAATADVQRRAAQLREQHGEFVLFLGCLRAYKGIPYLLEALQERPGVHAVIAGEGAQGPRLWAMARELGLNERVRFTGRVDQAEALALLHAAAIFILPAHLRSEAFGLCQIEAMACGTPVISTDLPTGVPEVNADGVSGLVVPPADARALAAAIGDLLADPAKRRALGEGGRRRAWQLFRAEQMAERVMNVYRETLNNFGL